jgi:hypothetical protein
MDMQNRVTLIERIAGVCVFLKFDRDSNAKNRGTNKKSMIIKPEKKCTGKSILIADSTMIDNKTKFKKSLVAFVFTFHL